MDEAPLFRGETFAWADKLLQDEYNLTADWAVEGVSADCNF